MAIDEPCQRAVKLSELKVGAKDQRQLEILDIYWSLVDNDDFVIYRTSRGVSPHFSSGTQKSEEQIRSYLSIGKELFQANALRSTTHWRGESIDREIARAIAQALEGDTNAAKDALLSVVTRLRNLRALEGRLEYLSSGFVAAVVTFVAWLLAYFLLGDPDQTVSSSRLLLIATLGAAGGFLSICVGVKTLEIDPDTNWKHNAVAGASRIVIAIVASIFVYFATKSGILLGAFNDFPEGIYAISIVAGFSEALVPNLLKKLGDQMGETRPQHTDNASHGQRTAESPPADR